MSMQKKNSIKRPYGGVEASLRKEDRRKKLILAGLEVFGTTGYAKSNIRTICSQAGLTERYFYESFKHKEDLLCAVYNELIEEEKAHAMSILEDAGIDPYEAASRSLKVFFHRFEQDPRRARVQLFEVLGVSPTVDRQYQGAMRILADMMKRFLLRAFPGISQEELDRSIIPTGLAGSMIQISNEWVLDGFKTPLSDIITESMDFFMAVGRHLEIRLKSS